MARAKADDGYLQISGKDLGAFAKPDACPRCLWTRLHVKPLPYQSFPGIFSSIDAYSKQMVHGWFDAHGAPPPWLARLDAFVAYREPPTWHRFQMVDDALRVRLTGAPDAVLVRADGSLCIADYKTARHTQGQDELLPVYVAQLNAYRAIAEALGWEPVTRLLLLYMEPATHLAGAQDEDGFHMGFHAKAQEVRIDVGLVPALLRQARATRDEPAPPPGRDACKDCAAVAALGGKLAGTRTA